MQFVLTSWGPLFPFSFVELGTDQYLRNIIPNGRQRCIDLEDLSEGLQAPILNAIALKTKKQL